MENERNNFSFKKIFFYKLHNLLDQERYKKYLRWTDDKNSFLILPSLLDVNDQNDCNVVKSIFSKLSVTRENFLKILKDHFFIKTEIMIKNTLYLKFHNDNFISDSKKLLNSVNKNTLEYVKYENDSPSFFNIKTIETLKKILDFLKILVSERKIKKDEKIKNILFYENLEDKSFVLKIVKILLIDFSINYTFQYNEFVEFLKENKYDFIIIDCDLFEIHKALSPKLDHLKNTTVLKSINNSRVYKKDENELVIYKPYTYDQIKNKIMRD